MVRQDSSWAAGLVVLALALGAAEAQESSGGSEAERPGASSDIQAAVARAEADLAALAELEATWRQQDEAQEAVLEQRLETIILLETQLSDAASGSPEAESIFDQVKPMASAALELLSRAIEAADQPLQLKDRRTVPVGRGRRPFGTPREETGSTLRQSDAAQTLVELERQEAEKLSELELLEVELRLGSIERHVALAGRIWGLREVALHLLPRGRRAEVFSFEGEGREELELELEAAGVVIRLQLLKLEAAARLAAEGVWGFLTAFKIGALTFKLVLVVFVWRWVQSNRARYIRRLRSRVETIEDPQQRQKADSGVEFLAGVAPWGVFLLMLGTLRWTLGESAGDAPVVAPLFIVATVYGAYRVISDLAVGLMADAMVRAGMNVSEGLRGSLAGRVRWVLRVATVFWLVIALLSYRLGHGVLDRHLIRLGSTVVIVLLFLVLGGLKREISDLFLAARARGRTARLVRKTRDRWAGRLVAPPAFLWLVVWSLIRLVRNVAYSFEGTRSAGAYLSRKRLERSAERDGYASGDPDEFPERLVAGLDSMPRVEDLEQLKLFSCMDEIREAVAVWRAEEGGGSVLLAGDEGVGKRAWISRFAELETVDRRIELDRRLMNQRALLRWLSRELLGEDESLSRGALISRIEEGPQRIVVIERSERLFLSTVNGYHALAELGPVVDGTRRKIFWILSIGGLGWNHLRAAGKDLAFLRRKVTLSLWNERQIGELIRYRLAAIDTEVSYANLMAGESRREDRESRDRQGEQAYMNLLWDFSGGNPKVALHYFVRSLETDRGGALQVRPFLRPSGEELEAIGESALFILAAIARHGSLTPREAARATDFQVDRVQARLIHLYDLDVVTRTAASYRLTTAWRSAVLLVLRRHNILVS